MPNVRRLLGMHGVTFQNAFVTTSLCCPSRASILTGLYSRHTGVYENESPGGGATAFEDRSTLPVWLHGAGYETALIGKYLNDYQRLGQRYIPPGWDRWVTIAQRHQIRYYGYLLNEDGQLTRYGRGPKDYTTTVLSQKAEEFVKEAAEPFFLYVAPIAPHLPVVPAPQDVGKASPPHFDPPSLNEPNLRDKPWGDTYPLLSPQRLQARQVARERILESLLSVDRLVGSLVDTLNERGVLDRTVLVFTSDNGLLLGEHRLEAKVWPYEESIRVPLVVRTPWAQAASTDDHLVLNIDLAPTLTELAGISPPSPVDGRSFADLLRGRSPPDGWRSEFVVEFLGTPRHGLRPPPFEALRTERYLYVEYQNGWRELYDLDTDRFELTNLAEVDRYREVRRRLQSRLQERLASPPNTGTPSPSPSSGS
jgi:N-acetylglucosamine-6-sulfatase